MAFRPSPVLACLLLAAAASAGDFDDLKAAAQGISKPVASRPVSPANPACAAQQLPVGGKVAAPDKDDGKFCRGIKSCKRWCCQACDAVGGGADCSRAPQTGTGMIPPRSPLLEDLGKRLHDVKVLTGFKGKLATAEVADGLQRLDAFLDGWDKRKAAPFTVSVGSCYRPASGDADKVCGHVFEFIANENKPEATPQGNADDEDAINKSVWGLAWPGATPHSAGFACDLVVVDAKGNDCFDWRAGPKTGAPTCSIDQRQAVDLINEAVAAAGGKRLAYEAWHFEWGGMDKCRCSGDGCTLWPLTPAAGCGGK